MKSIVTTQIETITPAAAAAALEKQRQVRKASAVDITRYQRAIENGAWHLNGESIKFDADGYLVDGQHRMHACVRAGCSFRSIVVRGISNTSEVDAGRMRKAGQVLQAAGNKNAYTLGSALRMLWCELNLGSMLEFGNPPSTSELLLLLEQHPRINDSVSICRYSRNLASGAALATIHYLGQERLATQANEFVSKLQDGSDLRSGSPILAYRERVFSAASTHAVRIDNMVRNELLVKAWNYHALGLSLHSLRLGANETVLLVRDPDTERARAVLAAGRQAERERARKDR